MARRQKRALLKQDQPGEEPQEIRNETEQVEIDLSLT